MSPRRKDRFQSIDEFIKSLTKDSTVKLESNLEETTIVINSDESIIPPDFKNVEDQQGKGNIFRDFAILFIAFFIGLITCVVLNLIL